MVRLKVNGEDHEITAASDMPLLWVLRDALGLKGAKYSCEAGLCGICTVHVNGQATCSCVTPLSAVSGSDVVTIEGLARDPGHPVLRAWLAENVPQCGYCQPGQIMAAAALLNRNPFPTDADIDAAMSSVLCRCGTYLRIRRAIHRAARLLREHRHD